MVVIGLGKNLLLKSILGHCDPPSLKFCNQTDVTEYRYVSTLGGVGFKKKIESFNSGSFGYKTRSSCGRKKNRKCKFLSL